MTARVLMIQGTGSDVGKSMIVAGLARAFTRRGLRVRPFKPQNMSNNAAVTDDGGEIGRAQALQARAARVPPSVHMNPVLLKPQSDIGAQVVVQGKVVGTAKARDYQGLKPRLLGAVLESFGRLAAECDLVLVEGAGSASEVNLRANDIANMGFARAADVPVVLLGDIDRGGVIASLVGTKTVIDPADAAMIVGFIVNRFRGDPSLFDDGMKTIARLTGWQALGLVPFFDAAHRLPAEDALGMGASSSSGPRASGSLMSMSERDARGPEEHERPSASSCWPIRASPISTISILCASTPASISSFSGRTSRCRATPRWSSCRARNRPSPISPRCGTSAGTSTSGPTCGAAAPSWESAAATRCSAAASPIRTASRDRPRRSRVSACSRSTRSSKATRCWSRSLARPSAAACRSRDMKCMSAAPPAPSSRCSGSRNGQLDGAVSADGRVAGCYIHGLLADDRQRRHWLQRIGGQASAFAYESDVDATLDLLADHLEKHIDCDRLLELAREPRLRP